MLDCERNQHNVTLNGSVTVVRNVHDSLSTVIFFHFVKKNSQRKEKQEHFSRKTTIAQTQQIRLQCLLPSSHHLSFFTMKTLELIFNYSNMARGRRERHDITEEKELETLRLIGAENIYVAH